MSLSARLTAHPNLLCRPLLPALVSLIALTAMALAVIAQSGGDPLALARLGTRYATGSGAASGVASGEAVETQGYDGQFVYYLALDPRPQVVAPHLDVPAYRYQRILLPLLARLVSLGNPRVLPWGLLALNLLAQSAGTWAVGRLLASWGVSPWYALVYGLWAGFALAIRLDLPEPLAFGLVAGALLAEERGHSPGHSFLAWLLYGLALFAKETTLIFLGAQALAYLFQRRWRLALGLGLIALLPYALFQAWLWRVFGQPGIGSGGAMATPFELIPFMGLLRIGAYSLAYLLAMALVFGPAVVLPSVWGLFKSIESLLAGSRNVIVFGLLLNALSIPFLPFSTFRETGGLLRFACGLVLALLLFASCYRHKRTLNYSVFWMVLNVFLLKQ